MHALFSLYALGVTVFVCGGWWECVCACVCVCVCVWRAVVSATSTVRVWSRS